MTESSVLETRNEAPCSDLSKSRPTTPSAFRGRIVLIGTLGVCGSLCSHAELTIDTLDPVHG